MENKQKILLFTVSRGMLARNLLAGGFYRRIREHFDQIIILTPAYNDPRFLGSFSDPKVKFLPLPEPPYTKMDQFLARLNCFLIYNRNTIRLSLYDYVEPPSMPVFIGKYIKYLILRLFFQPLSHWVSLRQWVRHLDNRFCQQGLVTEYLAVLQKERPGLVFATSLAEDTEAALILAARQLGIHTVAMAKTWDNPSKRYFRAEADQVLVWSEFMKQQMIRYQDYSADHIQIVGVPQFDFYVDPARRQTRKEFCDQLGLDPNKRIIFFGSEGKLIPTDREVAEEIYKMSQDGKLATSAQLLIRPHFSYKGDELKFQDLSGKPGVVVDTQNKPSAGFRDAWDYSEEQTNRLANSLWHADVIISTCSTLVLDAASIGKPSILINFDGKITLPLYRSCRRWYICDYFAAIFKFGAVPLADTLTDLQEKINKILLDGQQPAVPLYQLRDFFCDRVDGRAGERMAENLISLARLR